MLKPIRLASLLISLMSFAANSHAAIVAPEPPEWPTGLPRPEPRVGGTFLPHRLDTVMTYRSMYLSEYQGLCQLALDKQEDALTTIHRGQVRVCRTAAVVDCRKEMQSKYPLWIVLTMGAFGVAFGGMLAAAF